jgi:hypothetical protein
VGRNDITGARKEPVQQKKHVISRQHFRYARKPGYIEEQDRYVSQFAGMKTCRPSQLVRQGEIGLVDHQAPECQIGNRPELAGKANFRTERNTRFELLFGFLWFGIVSLSLHDPYPAGRTASPAAARARKRNVVSPRRFKNALSGKAFELHTVVLRFQLDQREFLKSTDRLFGTKYINKLNAIARWIESDSELQKSPPS